MDPGTAAILMPVFVVGLALIYAGIHRYLKHKERMAMIEKGIAPADWDPREVVLPRTAPPSPTRGLTAVLIGLALTIGLLTLGIGPWLLAGLIPMAWGGASLIGYYLEAGRKERD
ncbi:MAG TPA: DUF6249 domain-containing protein [Limnochordia bacterium]